MMVSRDYLLIVALWGITFAAPAQRLFGSAGALDGGGGNPRTFSWEVDYQQPLSETFAIGGGWINEGHLTGHHRDGATAQLWVRTSAIDRRLTLSAGIGPYAYFDTIPTDSGDGSHDNHGVGFVASLAANWDLDGPWSVELRANRIGASGVNTTSLTLGVGYRFAAGAPPRDEAIESASPALGREVAVLLGQTIVNTLGSEDALAAQIEYRQQLGSIVAWSVSALHEGDATTQRRSGLAAQIWFGGGMPDQRLTAAVGIGPYVVLDIESASA